jgi:hypothetical protein
MTSTSLYSKHYFKGKISNQNYLDCLRFRERLFCKTLKESIWNYLEKAFKSFKHYLEATYIVTSPEHLEQICRSLAKYPGERDCKFKDWEQDNGWWVLARYFGNRFPKDADKDKVDPSGLLHLIWNCNIFDPEIQQLAYLLKENRHQLYGHIPHLFYTRHQDLIILFRKFDQLYSLLSQNRDINVPCKPLKRSLS